MWCFGSSYDVFASLSFLFLGLVDDVKKGLEMVQESREGYGKNWMHFVYKMDNLFRSIKISYGNSSVTIGISYEV